MTVVTRFPPSPTGFLHLGGARTALFAYAYARHHGGQFVLRIEDTDRARSTEAAVQAILEGMDWLGLDYDQGPIYQTARFERYLALVSELLNKGLAYRCNCTKARLDALRESQMAAGLKPKYDGKCRDLNLPEGPDQVVRFKTPQTGAVRWVDAVRGEIEIQNTELDDLIIVRSDGSPTYNFCVVVDDRDCAISHVIRGEDHINNTPRQIHLYHALDAALPTFAHVPMILGSDGTKMSKRHGALSIMAYRDEGFLPEAMLNYLIRLGWSCGDEEIFSKAEMIEQFSLKAISRSPATFNLEKLLWLNQHYLKTLPIENVINALAWHVQDQKLAVETGPNLADIVPLMVDRVKTLKALVAGIRYFYEPVTTYEEAAVAKVKKGIPDQALAALAERLATCEWTIEQIHAAIVQTAESLSVGMGKVGMPLRLALTGSLQSPSIDATTFHIGRDRVIARIEALQSYLAS